ncbi:hypothetical protein Hdeb2414_s0004g00121801 [Helianthus debilis subsp. tardiflorus]
MLAMMSKGHYDASYDADSIETRMQMWASKAASSIMTNIVIDGSDDLEVCLCTSLFFWFEGDTTATSQKNWKLRAPLLI